MPWSDAEHRRRRRSARRLAVVSCSLVVLLGASLSALFPLIGGSAWWFACVAAGAAALLAASGTRLLGGASLLATGVAGVVSVCVLTAGFAPATAILGFVPTPESIDSLVRLGVEGAQSVYRQAIPASADTGIVFLLVCGSCLMAVVLDAVSIPARLPALGGIAVLGITVLPSLMTGVLDVWPFVASAVAYILVLWADNSLRRSATPRQGFKVIAIGAAAIVGAGMVTVSVPGFYGGSLLTSASSRSFGAGVSPLIDLGKDLQSVGGIEQFRYTTTAEHAPYFRLMTLDSFDGTTWVSSREPGPAREFTAGDPLQPPNPGEEAADTAQSTIAIEQMRDRVLPVPYAAMRIDGLEGSWLWNETDMTVRSRTASTVRQRYTVMSRDSEPTPEQLRESNGQQSERFERELEIGEDVPELITRTLSKVTADADSQYDAAYAIQQFLRDGDFSYSLSTPVQQGYDGDSLGVVATFLERRSGYCVHFASTMAVLSRLAGIPSRIVLGYLPGDRIYTAPGQATQYAVESDDLHAWPELHFEGVGWVAFEPTPGRGEAPEYAPAPESEAAAPLEPELPRASASATPTPSASASESESPSSARRAQQEDAPAGIGIIIVGILLLAAAPSVARSVRSFRRRSRLRRGDAGPEPAWKELEDLALDLGTGTQPNTTPRSFAAELSRTAEFGNPERAALSRLVSAVERVRYGPRESARHGQALVADLDLVTSALWAQATPRARVVARLAPRSVLARRTQVPSTAQL